MAGSILLSDIAQNKFTKLAGKHTHLRLCEQLIKRKYPQSAPAILETSFLTVPSALITNHGAYHSFCGIKFQPYINSLLSPHFLKTKAEISFLVNHTYEYFDDSG
jgi:hypothetical protein